MNASSAQRPDDSEAIPIEIEDLCVGYAGTPVLSGVSISVNAGEYLGIIGPH